jgi:hypothetical protein
MLVFTVQIERILRCASRRIELNQVVMRPVLENHCVANYGSYDIPDDPIVTCAVKVDCYAITLTAAAQGSRIVDLVVPNHNVPRVLE